MPCDQVRITTATSQLKGANLDLLKKALEGLGLSVWSGGSGPSRYLGFRGYVNKSSEYMEGQYGNDTLTVSHKKFINRIKVAYSKEVIKDQAEQKMWSIEDKGDNRFEATKPRSNDKINIEVLQDGTIKTTTDKISAANHSSAEQFLLGIDKEMGGETTITHKHGVGAHTHAHGQMH